MRAEALRETIRHRAWELGFDACGFVAADQPPHAPFFLRWLEAGRAGEMAYLARYQAQRLDPSRLALAQGGPPLRTGIVLAVDYGQAALPREVLTDPSRGIVASYAWGEDYHDLIRPLLHELDGFIRDHTGRTVRGKALVDTGPVLERDWAQVAGIGFLGKNCCTIRPGQGSWLFLATLWIPEVLPPDPPARGVEVPLLSPEAVMAGLPWEGHYGWWSLSPAVVPGPIHAPPGPGRSTPKDPSPSFSPLPDTPSQERAPAAGRRLGTCGRCVRCLEACPTGAFVGPYHLNPLRCISYWTIEARTAIPRELRPGFGNRIFGCDICQEVCPWNRRRPSREPRLPGLRARAAWMAPPLLEGFHPESPYWLVEEAFRERWRRSPVRRARRVGMLRNVCVALGNWAHPSAVPALVQALGDPDPLPRVHAAWALGQVLVRSGDVRARSALEARLAVEADERVREEIRVVLGGG